jgi:hypothetical protein
VGADLLGVRGRTRRAELALQADAFRVFALC